MLSLQHNFIKRIHNLDFISRLVFLDLYHNRLDHIAGLEPLNNLRVLMLGKNRIRKIECLTDCPKLSVLDLHGNRIGSIVGLEKLKELKVLNLASNLIRKVNGLQNLSLLEELNLRRNRIRTTTGLESVSSLQKLYMSNNEIQGLSSLNLESLTKLQTIQMEGNPVWSNPDYSYHLVSSLPSLVTLDQQDVSLDTRTAARRWKETKLARVSSQPSPNRDQPQQEKSKALLFKKLEERNASITNAKHRWKIIKTKTLASGPEEENEGEKSSGQEMSGSDPDTGQAQPDIQVKTEVTTKDETPKPEVKKPETETKPEVQITLEVPSMPEMKAGPKVIKRQSSERSLIKPSLSVTPPSSQLGQKKCVGSGQEQEVTRKISAPVLVNMPPPLPIRDSAIRIKFPGLERRRFALPQRYETLNDSDESQKTFTRSNSLQDLNDKQKIGFFTVQQPKKPPQQGESSSTCQSDDEDLSGGFISDSSSDSSESSDEPHSSGFPGHTGRRILDKTTARGRSLAKNVTSSRSSSQLSEERGPSRHWVKGGGMLKTPGVRGERRRQEGGEHGGRTSEQGKDYLIELDGDLLR